MAARCALLLAHCANFIWTCPRRLLTSCQFLCRAAMSHSNEHPKVVCLNCFISIQACACQYACKVLSTLID